jgi:Flp pilus assembly protein TadG
MIEVVRRLARARAKDLADFGKEKSGAVAVLFGLALIPILFSAGVAIDYGRATMLKSKLQQASDAAALTMNALPKTATSQDKQNFAINRVNANLGATQLNNITVTETEPTTGVYQIAASATIPTTVMKLAKINTIKVNAFSEARVTLGNTAPVEIALALDNTGSMSNNMNDLKAAAVSLVNKVMGDGSNTNIRVSVVPYVAAVNPGLTDMSMVDMKADTMWNAHWFAWAWAGLDTVCTTYWGPPSTGGGGGGGTGAGGSGDARDLIDILDPFRKIASELFGVTQASAADITPNTVPPIQTRPWTSPTSGKTFNLPLGYAGIAKDAWGQYSTGGCDWMRMDSLVSAYELFKRTIKPDGTPVTWKGCVEARLTSGEANFLRNNYGWTWMPVGKDYDVTEIPPSADDVHSLFTPYFWPDEMDVMPDGSYAQVAPGPYSDATRGMHNSYLKSARPYPSAWGMRQLDYSDWGIAKDIFAYDGTTPAAIIQETPGADGRTYGPNAGCPDAVLRLTTNKAAVLSKINNMNYWLSGGTIISEGLMWAWRTLSPNPPYADAKPYNTPDVQKVIVLMTDGVNELIGNGNDFSPSRSDYSAYGYLGAWRMSTVNASPNYAAATAFLDSRLQTACTNAKAAGIKIYTVTFNHTGFLTPEQQAHAADMLKQCASKPENAFLATDAASLTSAFSNIAVSATSTPLRLTQ